MLYLETAVIWIAKKMIVLFITFRLTTRIFLFGMIQCYLLRHRIKRNWLGLFAKRAGSNFPYWVRTVENVLYNSNQLRSLRKSGFYFPSAQTWFITDQCDQDCDGCPWAVGNQGSERKPRGQQMTVADWVRLGRESIDNGCMLALILGGEPMMEKEMIKKIKEQLGDKIIFIVFTNGDLVEEQDIIDFRRLGIILAINIGSGRKDDKGAYRALRLAKQHGLIAGASVTVTQENYKEVTSQQFVNQLAQEAIFAFYFHYMPSSNREADSRFVLSKETFWKVEQNLVTLKGPLRILHYSECRAGFGLVSVAPTGDVKMCAFCNSDSASLGNIQTSSLFQIFNSGPFSKLRRLNADRACLVLSQTGQLEEMAILSANAAAAVRKCNYPRGYIRKPPFGIGFIIGIRNKLWGRR